MHLFSVNTSVPQCKAPKFNKKVLNYDAINKSNCLENLRMITNLNELSLSLTNIVKNNTKVIAYNKHDIKRNLWTNSTLLKDIKCKEKLYGLFKKNPNNSEIKSKYLYYSNKVNNLRKFLKKKYYDNLFSEAATNLKKTWGLVNHVVFNKEFNNKPTIKVMSINNVY